MAAFNATELRIVLDELFTVLNNGTSVTSLNESVLTQTLEGLATQRVNKVCFTPCDGQVIAVKLPASGMFCSLIYLLF